MPEIVIPDEKEVEKFSGKKVTKNNNKTSKKKVEVKKNTKDKNKNSVKLYFPENKGEQIATPFGNIFIDKKGIAENVSMELVNFLSKRSFNFKKVS